MLIFSIVLLSNVGNAFEVLCSSKNYLKHHDTSCLGIRWLWGCSPTWNVVFVNGWIAGLLVQGIVEVISFVLWLPPFLVRIASRDLPCDSSSSRSLLQTKMRWSSCVGSGERSNRITGESVHLYGGLRRVIFLGFSLQLLRLCSRTREDVSRLYSLRIRPRSSFAESYLVGTNDEVTATTCRQAVDL